MREPGDSSMKKFTHRYDRNYDSLSERENDMLNDAKVCVIGCGGLGGYIIEYLGRIGVGSITVVDGDVFCESNLNRQILSSEKFIGKSKALTAKARMKEVNSTVEVNAVYDFFTEENAAEILKGCDIAVDALDSADSKLLLEKSAAQAGIPLIHGAIAGWTGQVAVCMPGSNLLSKIYDESGKASHDISSGNLPFTAGVIAGMEASEVVKLITGRGNVSKNKLLVMDLQDWDFEEIEL